MGNARPSAPLLIPTVAGARTIFGDRFQIVALLGRGGSSDVYEAIDRERDAPVALKALRDGDERGARRLHHEFHALQGVHHPNLVRHHELYDHDGRCFITMELVRGASFLRHIRADAARLRPALLQAATGLAAIHQANKIHRDIKSRNVLVTDEGRAVIIDFGLVVGIDDEASQRSIAGTAMYMAPEQTTDVPPAPSADWYAFGTLIYAALVGATPFRGAVWQILDAKRTRMPPRPSGLARDVPPDLEELCLALLQIDPRARPCGADVVRELGTGLARDLAQEVTR